MGSGTMTAKSKRQRTKYTKEQVGVWYIWYYLDCVALYSVAVSQNSVKGDFLLFFLFVVPVIEC